MGVVLWDLSLNQWATLTLGSVSIAIAIQILEELIAVEGKALHTGDQYVGV